MSEEKKINADSDLITDVFGKLRLEMTDNLSSGLLYTHSRITYNTQKTLEASSFLYALVELLDEKGVLSIEELDQRKKQVAGRLIEKFEERRIGLMYQDPEEDKYASDKSADVDCGSRLHVCESLCCKLPFALSRQDVEEGIIRWEFGRPYLIAHDNNGYCVHLDGKTRQCAEYDHRPLPCRIFNCRNNDKWPVWKDYDKAIINPEFRGKIEESNEKLYTYAK